MEGHVASKGLVRGEYTPRGANTPHATFIPSLDWYNSCAKAIERPIGGKPNPRHRQST